MPRKTLEECPNIDVIVRGEGEITFTELLEKYEKHGKNKFSEIKGITYRKDKKIHKNPDRPLIKDLDTIPFPAYHLMPMERYKAQEVFYALKYPKNSPNKFSIITSRGCPFNCAFCASRAIWGPFVRYRSAENVIDEINLLKNKYKIKQLSFLDDAFTINKNRVKSICSSIIKEKFDITWTCITRVDVFSHEMCQELKNANCKMIIVGIESAVQKVLDFLKKEYTVEDAKRAVMLAYKMKMDVAGFFTIGIPGETKEMINKTIKLANTLPLAYAGFSILTPFPGTEIYKLAEEKKWLLHRKWDKYKYAPSTKLPLKIPELSSFEIRGLYYKAILSSIVKEKIWNIKHKKC
jgi:radical SAM superfamily enzyme YgiQ (UPF0313 family)